MDRSTFSALVVAMAEESYRDAVERLEEIVRSLEGDELDLDKALQLFEEGVKRLRGAREQLKKADIEIKKVVEQADGTLREDDLDL